MIYPLRPIFDSRYSIKDRNIIETALNKIDFELWNRLRVLVGEKATDMAFLDLKTEITADPNHRLLGPGLGGVATRDINVNYCPLNPDRFQITLRSGVFSMERAHSLIKRLVPKGYTWIDVIHWLYNEQKLYTVDYRTLWNQFYFGGALKLVLPDITYGWLNQKEIMEGIKSGKYREGKDEYSSDGNPSRTYATEHELEHIRRYLIGH